MANKDIYDVFFVGQDYQPISDAAKSMKIMQNGKEYVIDFNEIILKKDDTDVESNLQIAGRIVDTFLDEVAPNGFCKELGIGIIINSSHGKNKKLYDVGFGPENDRGYFCGVVGVIRKPLTIKLGDKDVQFNITLQIKSRLDVSSEKKISKPFFLSTMLLRDKVKLSNNTIPSNEDEIFDYLLLFWFAEQLEKARLKGYYKTYRRFYNNDDKVKGTFDIARHIKLNAGQKNGRIAYTHRENTINNYLNQLIVAAYYHLKNKYYDLVEDNFDNNNELKSIINYLSNETEFLNTNVKNIMKNNFKAISHPYFTEYEELRVICLCILRDEGISVFDGKSDNGTQGILFYLPELWEKFLEDKLIKEALPEEIKMESQFKIKNFDEKQPTYPDYVFFDSGKPFMILDAKCKPKWEDVVRDGSLSDVMGDYNKCIRDMVAANSHATGVIFPTNKQYEQGELDRIILHSISKYNKLDRFYTIPVSIPYVDEDDTYSDWKSKFDRILREEIGIIKEKISEEAEFAKNNRSIFESIKR